MLAARPHLGLVALSRRAWKAGCPDPHAGNLRRLSHVVFRRSDWWCRLALVAIGFDRARPTDETLFALAGCSVFATGWAIKFILITRAAYNQGFALAHTPIRGFGVPGPAVKPGWSSP